MSRTAKVRAAPERGPEFAVCLAGRATRSAPAHLAVALEARGFDIFFLPENSHVPVTRRGPDKFQGDMRELSGFYDPFVALAACAARTRAIRLGTSVALLTQRDPLTMARSVASLDQLSKGRVVLGVAGGFIREAMANHGSSFSGRWQIVRERVAAMRAIWCEAEPRYCGTHEHLPERCPAWPTRQRKGPPVWIGSNSASVPARVAAWADGWLVRPAIYPGDPFADLAQACRAAGRPRQEVSLALMDAPWDREGVARAVAAGYDMLVHIIRDRDAEPILARLDRLAQIVAASGTGGP